MISKEVLTSSVIVRLLKATSIFCVRFLEGAEGLYASSRLKILLAVFEGGAPALVRDSKFIRWAAYLFVELKRKANGYFNSSLLRRSLWNAGKEVALSSFKALGVVLIFAVAVNFILSLALKQGMEIYALLMRGLLLAIGVMAMFCDADWATLRNGSLISKVFFND